MSGVRRIFGWIVRTAAIAGLIAFTVLLVWAFESRKMPALGIWHTVHLTDEFTTRDATAQETLQDYLDQEERLFRELQVKIYDRLVPTAEMTFSRYRAGGLQDPQQLPRNWNRTFELVPENIQGGALLLTASPTHRTVCAASVRSSTGKGSTSSVCACPAMERYREP